VLLAGCPQDQAARSAAPGKVPPQVTAPAATAPVAVPAQNAAPQKTDNTAHTALTQQLIQRAEQSYRSGVENYRAGRFEAARHDFDSAVDTMLTSGMDLRRDPQLSDEFEHLLDAINSLEMDALKQGNGLSPAIEAAPLDTASEVTFPPNAALTEQVTAELKTTQSDFPLVVNDYVAGFISYFTNSRGGHAHMVASLERAGKYKDMMQKILREEGVPQDLIYLAVMESGFQPQALNYRSGAGGMWQFMPFTAAYGLERNGWVDERFDPEKSTRAYARYIKSLHEQLGDWYLAMAAYDWGPLNVQRAVTRTGYADFWELYRRGNLPAETKNYVPGIIAAIIMTKNPAQYGLDHLTLAAPVHYDTVQTNYAVDLRLVADVTGATLEDIVALNPSLLRMTTPADSPFDLHLPTGTLDAYNERLANVPEDKRNAWRYHIVRAGESLETIASAMHVRPGEIAAVNSLASTDPVGEGDELVIPVVSVAPRQSHYTVRRGDTLVTIADRFGVSTESLRRWNHLKSNVVRPGSTIAVTEPVRLAPSTRMRQRRHHSASTASHGTSRATHSTQSHASRGTSSHTSHGTSTSRARRRAQ